MTWWWFGYMGNTTRDAVRLGIQKKGTEAIFAQIENDVNDIESKTGSISKNRADKIRQEEEKIAKRRKKISEDNGNVSWCVQDDDIDCIYEKTVRWGRILGQEKEGTLVGNCSGFMGACTELVWIEQNSVDGSLGVGSSGKPGVFIRIKHNEYTGDLGGRRIVNTVKRIIE